jgi:hypothetical protein
VRFDDDHRTTIVDLAGKGLLLHRQSSEFDVKDVVIDPTSGWNSADDVMTAVLEDHSGDPAYQELKSLIDALTEDEQADLVALTWLGRGDATIDEWDELRQEVARLHSKRMAAYLLAEPMLADHLEEGLSQFGRSCDDVSPRYLCRACVFMSNLYVMVAKLVRGKRVLPSRI